MNIDFQKMDLEDWERQKCIASFQKSSEEEKSDWLEWKKSSARCATLPTQNVEKSPCPNVNCIEDDCFKKV